MKAAGPMILIAGAAALAFAAGGKKKKKKEEAVAPGNKYIEVGIASQYGGGSDEMLVLDQECAAIANKLDFGRHNTWVTNRYHQLTAEGMVDPQALTLQLLREQSDHCPWDDPSAWTPMMKGLHDQLLGAVQAYGKATMG